MGKLAAAMRKIFPNFQENNQFTKSTAFPKELSGCIPTELSDHVFLRRMIFLHPDLIRAKDQLGLEFVSSKTPQPESLYCPRYV